MFANFHQKKNVHLTATVVVECATDTDVRPAAPNEFLDYLYSPKKKTKNNKKIFLPEPRPSKPVSDTSGFYCQAMHQLASLDKASQQSTVGNLFKTFRSFEFFFGIFCDFSANLRKNFFILQKSHKNFSTVPKL